MDYFRLLVAWHHHVTNVLIPLAMLLELEEAEEEEEQRRAQAVARPPMVEGRGRQRRRRRKWVSEWLQERQHQGAWDNLLPMLARTHQAQYRNTLRMDEALFDEILERIRPRITRQTTNWRQPVEPGLRLAITLRFLATGDSYASLALLFRVHRTTVGLIIYDTCEAIINEFMDEVIVCPTTPTEWRNVAAGFKDKWNVEHVIGAIDGKHVRITAPPRSGSYYFNYKGYHSIVLLGVVDANYKFRYVSVGANGATCDAQVFFFTELYRKFAHNQMGLPPRECIRGEQNAIPYFLVGDVAFSLKEWLMKPYPQRGLNRQQRLFNYRLSRARRVVENAYGILAQRFQCLLKVLQLHPRGVEKVTLACCILHNLLRDQNPVNFMRMVDRENPHNHDVIPGEWRDGDEMVGLEPMRNPRALRGPKNIRDYLAEYFSTRGAVEWQDRILDN